MATIVETKRLRLRLYRPDDAEALYAVFADPYARRFYPRMSNHAKIEDWIAWNLRNYEAFGFGLWVVEPREEPRLIGDCGLTYQEVEGEQLLEIGYHMHAAERGQGYATEAALAVLSYAQRVVGADFVCSIVDPANFASRAVAGRVHERQRDYLSSGKRRLLFYTEWLAPDAGLPPR